VQSTRWNENFRIKDKSDQQQPIFIGKELEDVDGESFLALAVAVYTQWNDGDAATTEVPVHNLQSRV